MTKPTVTEKTWEEFRGSGFLWWINMILHTFGWAIVYAIDENKVSRVYPARVKFRGFDEQRNTKGYQQITDYLADNANELRNESHEE